MYHYHMLPPCLVNKANIKTNLSCSSITECANDLKQYALDAYVTAATKDAIIGVAKDGHMILAPHQADGTVYDCKVMD